AMAVGMAIAERHLNAEFGDDLVDHRTWVVAGDGCLMEGINHEAAGLAAHLGLGRLIMLWDDNRITIDGATDLSTSEDIEARYAAYGWHVGRCDGLDGADVRRALDEALADPPPSVIACRPAPTKRNSPAGSQGGCRRKRSWTTISTGSRTIRRTSRPASPPSSRSSGSTRCCPRQSAARPISPARTTPKQRHRSL